MNPVWRPSIFVRENRPLEWPAVNLFLFTLKRYWYNMNLIPTSFDLTEVKRSAIHGFGVYAKADIKQGTIWWKGEIDKNVLLFNKDQYFNFQRSANNKLKADFWKMLSTYSYYSNQLDSLIVCLDNARYVNHADLPNSGPAADHNPLISIALRDIEKGEEILEDYDVYDQCPWAEILKLM